MSLNFYTLSIYVVPKSSQNQIVEQGTGGVLRIKVRGVPSDNEVNENLLNYLKKLFRPGVVEMSSGFKSRRKSVRIYGITEDQIKQVLQKEMCPIEN